jgi:tetratricopeptide (TPR) repeat protein
MNSAGKLEASRLDESLEAQSDVDSGEIDQYRRHWESNPHDNDLLLQYAVVLSRSKLQSNRYEALSHLESLVRSQYALRESLYHLSVLLYSMRKYDEARRYIEELYRMEPESVQIKRLHQAITYMQTQELQNKLQKQRQNTVTAAVTVLGAGVVAIGMIVANRKK